MLKQTAPVVAKRQRARAPIIDVGEIAQQRLRQCPYPILHRIDCRYHEGVLILRGEVPTFYMKQIAQTILRSLKQVQQIDNRLVVSS